MKKILIANRGEIACRVIRSCKSLNIKTVAIYSEVDKTALHVELADEAFYVGPAKASESYLNVNQILATCIEAQVDAVHPGYGFLSENSEFANLLEKNNIRWIGPSPQSILDMGDKERARSIAANANVPILPGSKRFAYGENSDLLNEASNIGFPLLVKASAGGGGIGMRLVQDIKGLIEVVTSTQEMAQRSFGDGTVFLERYIPRARHIEIQIFGFGDGRAIHLYDRECSIQRRFQKVIEESPAPEVPREVIDRIANSAVNLASNQKYSGAGTVEFIVDADTLDYYFLEMNTRIQVEHPVTEMVTMTDLVSMQIKLAFGESFSHIQQDTIEHKGHAIEARIYAEDPSKMFLPSPGSINNFYVPYRDNENVRLETGVKNGDKISAYYDPMIAKVICYGPDRKSALALLKTVLESTKLDGIKHNINFLIKTLSHQEFVNGNLSTGFIDDFKNELIS